MMTGTILLLILLVLMRWSAVMAHALRATLARRRKETANYHNLTFRSGTQCCG
jgi:hypothetical protein